MQQHHMGATALFQSLRQYFCMVDTFGQNQRSPSLCDELFRVFENHLITLIAIANSFQILVVCHGFHQGKTHSSKSWDQYSRESLGDHLVYNINRVTNRTTLHVRDALQTVLAFRRSS